MGKAFKLRIKFEFELYRNTDSDIIKQFKESNDNYLFYFKFRRIYFLIKYNENSIIKVEKFCINLDKKHVKYGKCKGNTNVVRY